MRTSKVYQIVGQHEDSRSRAPDGLLAKWNGQSALEKSNGYFHLDGIIGVEGQDSPWPTGNSGTISRVKKEDYLQELKSKSGELDSAQRN